MRNLRDVIDTALEGQPLSNEEATYAVLALNNLLVHINNDLFTFATLYAKGKPPSLETMAGAVFDRHQRCMESSPAEWIGWSNDPRNPEVKDRRKLLKAVVKNQLH